ncbi:MAG: hypothetical protein M1358_06960 [Chloroflexi bacterium]|nr:hypothetical protein [Chloroflexota bacterium]
MAPASYLTNDRDPVLGSGRNLSILYQHHVEASAAHVYRDDVAVIETLAKMDCA